MSRRTFLISASKAVTSSAVASYFPRLAVGRQTAIDGTRHHHIDRLHQIIIADGYGIPNGFLDAAAAPMNRFKQLYPSAEYTLWTGERLREFIAYHFGNDVVWAFDTLKPNLYKSDLARYCVLQEKGGLYSDLNVSHKTTWQVPRLYQIAAFKTLCVTHPDRFDIDNGMMWSQPVSAVLEKAINRIVAHCRGRLLGTRSIDTSGAGLLGWAWAATHVEQWQHGKADELYLGVARRTHSPGGIETHFIPAGAERIAVAQRTEHRQCEGQYCRDIDHAQAMYKENDVYQ